MTQTASSAHNAQQKPAPERAGLRKLLLTRRRQTAAAIRRQWDDAIMQALLRWCARQRPASLAVYWPIQSEPDLRDCYRELTAAGIQLCLPWVTGKQQPLKFLAWQDGDAMDADEYGIPLPAQKDALVQPEAILIPCVGFNSQGYRLGYGGGFYDRTLAGLPAAVTAGIAYAIAEAAFVAEAHDLPMQRILTENGWLELAAG